MSSEFYKAMINVAACICGKDGIISEAEERAMFDTLGEKFPDISDAFFEQALTDYFDSDDQIEDYLERIEGDDLRRFALHLAEISAGADGLETRENIALEKAYSIWGIDRHAESS